VCASVTDGLNSRRVSQWTIAAVVDRQWAEESNPLRHLRLDARTAVVAARDHDLDPRFNDNVTVLLVKRTAKSVAHSRSAVTT
jgi:hypothetical protein